MSRILNKLTPEKFDVLVEQLLNAGIESAEILKASAAEVSFAVKLTKLNV